MDDIKVLLILSILTSQSTLVLSCTCDGTTTTVNGEKTCFEVVQGSGGSWSSADKTCSQRGGFLAHIQTTDLLDDLKSLIDASSNPLMVGEIVGNAEYSMIAYMCPRNAYKSLVNKTVIQATVVGDASNSSTCLFIQSDDHKLHYGQCTQSADVLCQIPMETTDYCGIMCGGVTASSTTRTSKGLTVAASTMPNECNCNGITTRIDGHKTCFEIESGSGGTWRSADQRCSSKNGFLAHIRDGSTLGTVKNYVKSNYNRPVMVGHIVGNAEYSLIAYMCPNNSYQSLVNKSVVQDTVNGNSTSNSTCLFIQDSDYKLHYGQCTASADVLCEIPLESDSRCGIMRTCSSTSSVSSRTTSSTRRSSSRRTSSNPSGSVNIQGQSGSNGSNNSSSNSVKPTSSSASSTSTRDKNSGESGSSSNGGSQSPRTSNSNSASMGTGPTSDPSGNSNQPGANGSNNNNHDPSSHMDDTDFNEDSPDGTFDKEETIGPNGMTRSSRPHKGNNGTDPVNSTGTSTGSNPVNGASTTPFSPNNNNSSTQAATGISTLRTRHTTHAYTNSSPTVEDILNMDDDYPYINDSMHKMHKPFFNDSMHDPFFNGTKLFFFEQDDRDGYPTCYGRAYSRVGRWCVAWWIWLLVVLLLLAFTFIICGIGCYFCGISRFRRGQNNIIFLDQPTQHVFIDKPRPTITTVVEQIEIIQTSCGPPSILYDIAVCEMSVPGYIVPPKPFYASSPMMMLGADDTLTRSVSLGMVEEHRLNSPSDLITHENLTGPKLGNTSPYDDRLPTGATSVIPPQIAQADSGNFPSMSDGVRDSDYNQPATNVPVKTFEDARRSAPGRSPTPSDEDFSDGIREFKRNARERQAMRF